MCGGLATAAAVSPLAPLHRCLVSIDVAALPAPARPPPPLSPPVDVAGNNGALLLWKLGHLRRTDGRTDGRRDGGKEGRTRALLARVRPVVRVRPHHVMHREGKGGLTGAEKDVGKVKLTSKITNLATPKGRFQTRSPLLCFGCRVMFRRMH